MEELDSKIQMAAAVYELLSPVMLLLLAYLAKKISDFLTAKVKNELLSGMLTRLNDTVFTYVREAEQTLVAELKAAKDPASEGGTALTKAEGENIKNKVLAKVKEALGPRGLSDLGKILGLTTEGVEGTIAAKIEAAVNEVP